MKKPSFLVILFMIIIVGAIGIKWATNIRWLFELEKETSVNTIAAYINSDAISWDAASDVPQPVKDYALKYVREQINYYNGLGYNIIDGMITALTRINTDTAALSRNIQMWLLEYRLLPENTNKIVLTGKMKMENGWISEWKSTGQPLLVLVATGTRKAKYSAE